MKQKFKFLLTCASTAFLSLAIPGPIRAQVLEKVSITTTVYSQNSNSIASGTTTTTKAPIKQIQTTLGVLEQLAHDEYVEGNLESETLPSGAALYFDGSGFEICKGTNLIVDVSDIFTWQVIGTNDISGAGSYPIKTGPGTPPFSQTDYYLVKVTYDDSAATGKLIFSITGLAIVTKSATAPNSKTGKYTESGSISFTDGTGEGTSHDNGPLVLTGFTLTASGSTTAVVKN